MICATASGIFLRFQVIYQGKTPACLPRFAFPDNWNVTFTPNHWSNEEKTLELGSTNRKINVFKITCKVMLCLGVGLIKKTLAWQQIPCIPCSGKIEKYLQIDQFSAVAIYNLVCCNQSSFSGLVTIFPLTLSNK